MRLNSRNGLVLSLAVVILLVRADILSSKIRRARAAVGPIWPQKKIPYAFTNIIEFDFHARDTIKAALREIEESLAINGIDCIQFTERENERDYILFVNKGDCSSGIGYYPGANNVSLAEGCHTTGIIIHEIMHRLGFDHEHSRYDRDQNVKVFLDNTKESSNFRVNIDSKVDIDAPYDFHSVIHYNSNAFKKNSKNPTLVSKIPALYSDQNEIHMDRNGLSPIDIYKIQKLYKCEVLTIPEILSLDETEVDIEKIEKTKNRFKLETGFNSVNESLADLYLSKTYETCGLNHVWPVDYPLVDSKHRLYKLMCIRKKPTMGRCRYSIECDSENAFCVRPFFKRRGYCAKFSNKRVNQIGQLVNDKLFEYGKKVKDSVKGIFYLNKK